MKPTLLILAAGMGSRYGGLKQTEPVGPAGETILEYSVYDAIRAGFGKVVFVIRKSFAEDFISRFESKLKKEIEIDYVFQERDNLPQGYQLPEGRQKPWGTGHAILMAKNSINEPFAAINADDFYGAPAFRKIAEFLTSQISPDHYAMVGYLLKNTLSDFGSVSRGICQTNNSGYLTAINERTKIFREDGHIYYSENNIKTRLDDEVPVSMNFWGFHPSLFEHLESQFRSFLDENIDQPKSEFYIPNVIFNLISAGKVKASVLQADSPWFGVTYPEDKSFVTEQVLKLTKEGIYPEKLWKQA